MKAVPFPYLRLHLLVSPTGPREPDKAGPDCAPDRPLGTAMLRRVLGKALIDRHCVFGEPRCQAPPPAGGRPEAPSALCCQAAACPYGVLFAASLSRRPPFTLFVPRSGAGAIELVELTLLGDAWRFFPCMVAGIQQALNLGLGRCRHSYRVDEVLRVAPDHNRQHLAHADLRALPSRIVPDSLLGGRAGENRCEPSAVEVELLSPLRLVRDGRLVRGSGASPAAAIPLQLLIARLLDRLLGLFPAAATSAELGCSEQDRSALEAAAASVPLLDHDLHWQEIPDFSARSGRELTLGGWVGRLTYGAGAARFVPLLRIAEILHLGKNPTAGCGRLRIDDG